MNRSNDERANEERPRDPVPGAGEDPFGFRSTRWSQVVAVRRGPASERNLALEELCQHYWAPVYTFIRCRGYQSHDAQDLTQAFFAELLSKNQVASAQQERGSFRNYLKTLIRHFLIDEHRAANALKRGGAQATLSFDPSIIEAALAIDSRDASPETRFERAWALEVLRKVLAQVEQEHREKGRSDVWGAISPFLTPGAELPPYERLALSTGLSVTALKVAVHRARERFRDVLRRTVADTLENEQEVDAEIQALMAALRG